MEEAGRFLMPNITCVLSHLQWNYHPGPSLCNLFPFTWIYWRTSQFQILPTSLTWVPSILRTHRFIFFSFFQFKYSFNSIVAICYPEFLVFLQRRSLSSASLDYCVPQIQKWLCDGHIGIQEGSSFCTPNTGPCMLTLRPLSQYHVSSTGWSCSRFANVPLRTKHKSKWTLLGIASL